MYAYTRDSEGHYTGTIHGETVTAHNREDFMRLAWQAEQRHLQRIAIKRRMGIERRNMASRVKHPHLNRRNAS